MDTPMLFRWKESREIEPVFLRGKEAKMSACGLLQDDFIAQLIFHTYRMFGNISDENGSRSIGPIAPFCDWIFRQTGEGVFDAWLV